MVFKRKAALLIPSLLAFSACSETNQVTSSESTMSSFSSESHSLEKSSSEQSSEIQSAMESSESSSDGKIYYTVSIYQSYLRKPDAMGRTGLRFDTALQIESGIALYRTTEEAREFYHQYLHPLYQSYGQSYDIAYLFNDPECTVLYEAGDPILSDSTFYYFGEG